MRPSSPSRRRRITLASSNTTPTHSGREGRPTRSPLSRRPLGATRMGRSSRPRPRARLFPIPLHRITTRRRITRLTPLSNRSGASKPSVSRCPSRSPTHGSPATRDRPRPSHHPTDPLRPTPPPPRLLETSSAAPWITTTCARLTVLTRPHPVVPRPCPLSPATTLAQSRSPTTGRIVGRRPTLRRLPPQHRYRTTPPLPLPFPLLLPPRRISRGDESPPSVPAVSQHVVLPPLHPLQNEVPQSS